MTFTMQNLSKRLDISNVTLYKYLKQRRSPSNLISGNLAEIWRIQRLPYLGGNTAGSFLQNIRFSLDEYLECREDMALLTTLSLFGRTFGEARKISSAKRSVRRRSLCSRKRSARGRSATIFRLRKSSDF